MKRAVSQEKLYGNKFLMASTWAGMTDDLPFGMNEQTTVDNLRLGVLGLQKQFLTGQLKDNKMSITIIHRFKNLDCLMTECPPMFGCSSLSLSTALIWQLKQRQLL